MPGLRRRGGARGGRGRLPLHRRPVLRRAAQAGDPALRPAPRDGHRRARRKAGRPDGRGRRDPHPAPTCTGWASNALAGLERMADKSAQNLLAAAGAVQAHHAAALSRTAWASATSARRRPRTWRATSASSTRSWTRASSSCSRCPDVGPVVAESIHTFFQQPHNREVVEQLRACGVTWDEGEAAARAPRPLAGKTVVLTGTLPTLSAATRPRTCWRPPAPRSRGRSARRPTTWSPAPRPAASSTRRASWASRCWTRTACAALLAAAEHAPASGAAPRPQPQPCPDRPS